jgi:tetratricopeptide (TPR) repeat protein
MQAAAILFSGSRGPVVGLAGAGLIAGAVALPRVRHWLWAPWLGAGVLGILLLVAVNLTGPTFSPLFASIREAPYVGRLTRVLSTEDSTARARILVWDAATELLRRTEPLGIPEDTLAPPDRLHAMRPLVGYGPETIKDVVAAVFRPELTRVGEGGNRPDRAHNETIDAVLTAGLLGGLAYYVLMISLLTYALGLLGWVGDRASRRTLISIVVMCGALGVAAATVLDRTGSPFTFVGLALPFGVVAGVLVHVALQCARRGAAVERRDGIQQALGLAVFAGVVGHFLEVQYAFSTASTHTYFWVFAGLLVALKRHDGRPGDGATDEREVAVEVPQGAPPQQNGQSEVRHRAKQGARRAQENVRQRVAGPPSGATRPSYRDASILGFMVAVMLVTLTMGFVRYQIPTTAAVAALFVIAWLAGLALLFAGAPRGTTGAGEAAASAGIGAAIVYSAASLGASLLYGAIHGINLSRWQNATTLDTVAATGAALANDVAAYVFCLVAVTAALAVTLTWSQTKNLPWARGARLGLHLPFAVLVGGVIWFENVDVIRADVYLKEAERYRVTGRHETALALYEKARSLDRDEDSILASLAAAQQAMANDASVESSRREFARKEGELVALEARRLNPYSPDTVSNLGRYYFDLGTSVDAAHLEDAVVFLQKALALAPFDLELHGLLARAHYMRGETQAAIDQLDVSLAVDESYFPSWSLLADYHLATGDGSQSLEALRRGLRVVLDDGREGFRDFITVGLENRVESYASAGRLADLVDTIVDATSDRMPDGLVPWAIGRVYTIQGEPSEAVPYFEEALPYLERTAQLTPLDVETPIRLAQVYRGLGRREEALQALGSAGNSEEALFMALELGVELAGQGLHAQAAEAFEQATASNNRTLAFAAHKSVGMMYFYNLDRMAEGVVHFERAFALDPENAEAPLLRQVIDEYWKR